MIIDQIDQQNILVPYLGLNYRHSRKYAKIVALITNASLITSATALVLPDISYFHDPFEHISKINQRSTVCMWCKTSQPGGWKFDFQLVDLSMVNGTCVVDTEGC